MSSAGTAIRVQGRPRSRRASSLAISSSTSRVTRQGPVTRSAISPIQRSSRRAARSSHARRRKVMQLATKLVSSKRGAIIVAASAALLAGILILLYLNSYRSGVKAEGAPVTVLIAQEDIPKGTSGTVIASSGLLKATTMRESQLREGAF